MTVPDVDALVEALLAGNRRALGRVLTQIENDTASGWRALSAQLPGAGVAAWTSPAVAAPAGTVPAGFVSYRLELYWKDPASNIAAVDCSAAANAYFATLAGFDTRGVTCATVTLRP